jgi:hypothetical protein
MPVRPCRITIQDMDGVSHTVEVTAATLYEAVAQGLAAIRGNEWVAGIAQGSTSSRCRSRTFVSSTRSSWVILRKKASSESTAIFVAVHATANRSFDAVNRRCNMPDSLLASKGDSDKVLLQIQYI